MSLSAIELHVGPWTEAEFLELPEDNRRIELLDGALLVSSPSPRHQDMCARMWRALDALRPRGMRVFVPIDVRVGPNRILVPDLVVVRHDRMDFQVLDAVDAALAIEIVSPGSVASDRAIKPPLYAQAGVPYFVRVELGGPTAVVGTLTGDRYTFGAPDSVLRLTDPFPIEIDLPGLLEN